MKKRVFLSYSAKDATKANTVCAALEAAGIPCWIAHRDAGIGDYGEAIIDAIEQAFLAVVLLSAAANDSVHVKNEAERATSKRKPIITFRIEDVQPAKRLELFLSSQQWIDAWTPPWKKHVRELVAVIRQHLVRAANQLPTELYSNAQYASAQITKLLQNHCWVGYDPTHYNPNPDCPLWPTDESIEEDISHIHAAGFSGIVTFGCRNSLALIPKLAKERGLAVIVGVWNPADQEQCKIASELRDHVDAYCMGHNNLGKAYQKDTLHEAICWLRANTQRPVTTSEEIRIYRDDFELCALGDWLFPDCHVSLRKRPGVAATANIDRNVKSYIALAREIVTLAKQFNRPLMLKMVTFPWAGADGASLEKQAEFFPVFLEALRDPESGLPGRVAIMFSSAFDVPWKNGHPFFPWDAYTGLLNSDGTPRPAVEHILTRLDRTA